MVGNALSGVAGMVNWGMIDSEHPQREGLWRGVGRELGAVGRLIRRTFYFVFRRRYVLEQVRRRKGVCGRHGCCDLGVLARFRRCIDPDDRTRCLKHDSKPFGCRMYPFDEKDKIPETRPYCSFHWDEGDEE